MNNIIIIRLWKALNSKYFTDPCSPNPCNNGDCIKQMNGGKVNGFKCNCSAKGFIDDHCKTGTLIDTI